MKSNVLSIEGKKLKEIELPNCFSQEIREDIIAKVLEAKKIKQPYAPLLVAGQQYSAHSTSIMSFPNMSSVFYFSARRILLSSNK